MLLIGESGVGKSRWINAFANYCKFRSLEEAVKAGGLFPIHCTFPIRDPQTGRMIYISSKGNDTTAISQPITVGDSVTKIPEDYGFVPGEPKKIPPTTFVDITAMHGNFCTKFYTIVKRSNIHFITKFY